MRIALDHVARDKVRIAPIGPTKSAKSTLGDCLAGSKILHTEISEATMCTVFMDDDPTAATPTLYRADAFGASIGDSLATGEQAVCKAITELNRKLHADYRAGLNRAPPPGLGSTTTTVPNYVVKVSMKCFNAFEGLRGLVQWIDNPGRDTSTLGLAQSSEDTSRMAHIVVVVLNIDNCLNAESEKVVASLATNVPGFSEFADRDVRENRVFFLLSHKDDKVEGQIKRVKEDFQTRMASPIVLNGKRIHASRIFAATPRDYAFGTALMEGRAVELSPEETNQILEFCLQEQAPGKLLADIPRAKLEYMVKRSGMDEFLVKLGTFAEENTKAILIHSWIRRARVAKTTALASYNRIGGAAQALNNVLMGHLAVASHPASLDTLLIDITERLVKMAKSKTRDAWLVTTLLTPLAERYVECLADPAKSRLEDAIAAIKQASEACKIIQREAASVVGVLERWSFE